MFINYSNHPSENWNEKQLTEAKKWGEVLDLPFLQVSADMSSTEVVKLAEEEVQKMMEFKPSAVLCQGEFTLSFSVIKRLQLRGVKVFAACSKRVVLKEANEDGKMKKESALLLSDYVKKLKEEYGLVFQEVVFEAGVRGFS